MRVLFLVIIFIHSVTQCVDAAKCVSDNVLRGIKHHSDFAFCSAFLVGHVVDTKAPATPAYLKGYSVQRISSACSCATSPTGTSTFTTWKTSQHNSTPCTKAVKPSSSSYSSSSDKVLSSRSSVKHSSTTSTHLMSISSSRFSSSTKRPSTTVSGSSFSTSKVASSSSKKFPSSFETKKSASIKYISLTTSSSSSSTPKAASSSSSSKSLSISSDLKKSTSTTTSSKYSTTSSSYFSSSSKSLQFTSSNTRTSTSSTIKASSSSNKGSSTSIVVSTKSPSITSSTSKTTSSSVGLPFTTSPTTKSSTEKSSTSKSISLIRSSLPTSESTKSSVQSSSTSATSSLVLPDFVYSYDPTPASLYQVPNTASYTPVTQTDVDIVNELDSPLISYLDGTNITPYYSTAIEGHIILYDFSGPNGLQFCDLTDSNCYSFRDDGMHVFPFAGGEAIAEYAAPSPSKTKRNDIPKRALRTFDVDPEFTAVAGFEDSCKTELSGLSPLPQFYYDTTPCVNSQVSGNTYQGVCKYVTAKELSCRVTAKSLIDKTFGSDSYAKDIVTLGKFLGKSEFMKKATTGLTAWVVRFAFGAELILAASVITEAIALATALRLLLVDGFGAANTAMVLCKALRPVCCLSDMLASHDVTVGLFGQNFKIASISEAPLTLVASPSAFKVKTPTCDMPTNLLRNGGFEEDGEMVPFPNGIGWWLPTPPSDPILFSAWDGWQVTSLTSPQAALKTTGCLDGARCLQMYAVAAGRNTAVTQIFQMMDRRFIPNAAYTFTFSYRIDFLTVASGVLDGIGNYCYLFSLFHDSDIRQPGFIKFTSEVLPGKGLWQTVTRTFNYQGNDLRASSDEFTLNAACIGGSSSLQFAVTIDKLIVLPVF